jgi:hypothetical protein
MTIRAFTTTKVANPPRPRGRRSVDLAAPPVRGFPTGTDAPEVLMAAAAARDLPQLSLLDALELTVLVARKDPGRHQRVASRWLPGTSRRILTRRSKKLRSLRRVSSRSRVSPTRRPRRHFEPWPKERLADGGERRSVSAGRVVAAPEAFGSPPGPSLRVRRVAAGAWRSSPETTSTCETNAVKR